MSDLATHLPAVLEATAVRLLDQADVERFHHYRSDAALATYQAWSAMTIESANAFVGEMISIKNFRRGGWIQLAIADAASNVLLGDIGVFLEADESVAEIGVTLCSAAHGQGHAVRAIQQVVSLVFRTTAVRCIRAIADSRNLGSIRMLERCDFVRCLAYQTIFKGEPCTEVLFVRCRSFPFGGVE